MNKIVVAVVGMPGAGKSVAALHILKKTNWPKVYFGGIVIEEVKKRGLEVNEKNERAMREELRGAHGMGAMATLSLPKIKELLAHAAAVLIESHYSWEEYIILKENFSDDFKVLAIYASPATRMARLESRSERPLTPEQVTSRDISQIENLHQGGPIAIADYTIVNEGSFDELYRKIDAILHELEELQNSS
jgi:dephospho-CoA kinase